MRDEANKPLGGEAASQGPKGSATDPWTDADWEAITDYVTGEMDPVAVTAIEHRLATDAAFAQFVEPLMELWRTPLPVQQRDRAAAWAAIERNVAEEQGETVSQPTVIPTAAPGAATRRQHKLPPWRMLTIPQVWGIAVLGVLVCSYMAFYVNDRARQQAFQYYAATGRPHTVVLADHSQVTLAPGAVLVADGIRAEARDGAPRVVHLDGTGTFVVHADPRHPFIVESYGVSASAIGTTFSVAVHQNGGGKNPVSTPSGSSPHTASPADIQVSVISGKVVVQRQISPGHRETIAVLGPGEETSVQTWVRHFKMGWDAAAAHKSIAEVYIEARATLAAESLRAVMKKNNGH